MFSAARILAIRKSKGYSQELLAEQSGISLRTIQRVEQGDTVPRGHTLHALAAALGVALEDFRQEAEPAAEQPELTATTSSLIAVPPPASLPVLLPAVATPTEAAQPAALRPDPEFLQLLNLSALSFLVVPLLNIVVPLLLWRKRRYHIEHAADVGRRVLGFQILWQVACAVTYLLLIMAHWAMASFFHVVLPSTIFGFFITSYVLNVLAIVRAAVQLRHGQLDIYRFRL